MATLLKSATARKRVQVPASASVAALGARARSARATRASLLRAAIRVFAKHGYSGASVEKISSAAKSWDRMIYYYFGSKEGLFVAVLEETYRRFNEAEAAIELDEARPIESLLAIVDFMVGYYRQHPEFVTLLNSENLHRGRHIRKSMTKGAYRAGEYASPAIAVVEQVLASGVAQRVFRRDLAARDVYLLIASAGYFYQSNRHTLSAFLGEDLEDSAAIAHWASFVRTSVLRTVCISPPS